MAEPDGEERTTNLVGPAARDAPEAESGPNVVSISNATDVGAVLEVPELPEDQSRHRQNSAGNDGSTVQTQSLPSVHVECAGHVPKLGVEVTIVHWWVWIILTRSSFRLPPFACRTT